MIRSIVTGMCLLLVVSITPMLTPGASAQTATPADTLTSVPVDVKLKGGARSQFDIVTLGEGAYFPLQALFQFLKIPIAFDPSSRVAEGIFLTRDNAFAIDAGNLTAKMGDRSISLRREDFALSGGDLFLSGEIFSQLFDIEIQYYPRKLLVTIQSRHRLPVYLERDREKARLLRNLKQETIEPDLALGRQFNAFDIGRLNYRLTSSTFQRGTPRRSYSFRLGNTILGGDMNTRLSGTVGRVITGRDIQSNVRYAFLDNPVLRQITLGDILSMGLRFESLAGVEITNRPAKRRIYFASDNLTGNLPEGGIADLYASDILVDYQPATTSGQYSFQNTLTYGVEDYEVRTYDPFGVEQVTQYRVVVPPEMVPPGEVEYTVSSGFSRLGNQKWSGNSNVNWGINSRITVGGGVDYSEVSEKNYHPKLSATTRFTDILVGNFVLAPSAYSRYILTAGWPSQVGISLRYSWYGRDSYYNKARLHNDALASLSVPLWSRTFGLNLVGTRTELEGGKRHSLQASAGGMFGLFSSRILHSRSWEPSSRTSSLQTATTSAFLSFRASGGFIFRGITRYHHDNGGFRSARFEFSKRIARRFWMQIYYDRNFKFNNTFAGIQFILDFPFTAVRSQVNFAGDGTLSSSQSLYGSVAYSMATGDVFFDNISSYNNSGAIIVQPFVDANANDIHDPGEEYISRGSIKSSTAFSRRTIRYKDGGFLIERTTPFEEYFFTIDPQNLDNPLWVPKYSTVSVISEPNNIRLVDIPLVAGGVVRGRVTAFVAGRETGLQNLTIRISPESGPRAGFPIQQTTYSTGEFEILGLLPGRYVLSVDQRELSELGYGSTLVSKVVEIKASPEGDEINDIVFRIGE